VIYFDVFVQAH